MSEANPYAAPAGEPGEKRKKRRRGGYSARLEGEALALTLDATLPAVCMKCGTHDEIVRRSVKFQWRPVWARLLVFCFIGVIVMLVTTKRTTLEVPLCARCNARWGVARSVALVALVALVGAFLLMRFGDDRKLGLVLFGAAVAGVVALSRVYVRPRLLQVKRIDDAEIIFAGIAPAAAQEIVDGSR